MKPPGKDALARRALREQQRRDERDKQIRTHGPDPGGLEPCPHCGRYGYPDDLTLPSGITIPACCDESRRSGQL